MADFEAVPRRCRVVKRYRPKTEIYRTIAVVSNDPEQVVQYVQVDFLEPFDGAKPVPTTVVCEFKSYDAERKRSRFVNPNTLNFAGEPDDTRYDVKLTMLDVNKKPVGVTRTFCLYVEDPADLEE